MDAKLSLNLLSCGLLSTFCATWRPSFTGRDKVLTESSTEALAKTGLVARKPRADDPGAQLAAGAQIRQAPRPRLPDAAYAGRMR